jgi:hypothetical protein
MKISRGFALASLLTLAAGPVFAGFSLNDVAGAVSGMQVISLDQASEGYGEFDAGVPKKFVIDPHKLFSAA